ncbi:exopolysaccharide biosynthesis polyprenyl glycosylphosphotransferase [Okibacterium sp. HSC-33S16]|uniref:sugar transferase n=1 Tax=Okibacterium sp. HSC-33S16 TaxID=2910965 RepID=UPI00209CC94A|nr:sugar transferase [Okibacterium sp. HSC-33S16]MCP2031565.1 exopolysaccharide biosynthesis polyprenyl glycosylphosphotransferase [Okibacterium sp. HSC-33S16]
MTEVKSRIFFPSFTRPRVRVSLGAEAKDHTLRQESERVWARNYRTRLRLTDVATVLLAVTIAFSLRFGIEAIPLSARIEDAQYILISATIVASWLVALFAFGVHDSRVIGVGASEYKRIINASATAFGLLAIVFLVLKVDIARGYFMLALPLGTVSLLGAHWLWRRWLVSQRTLDHYLCRALVVGELDDVGYVIRQIQQKSGAAYNVVGAVVSNTDAHTVTTGQKPVPVLGMTNVAQVARNVGADTVIIAGQPKGGANFIRNLGWQLEGTATDLVLASQLTDVAGPRIHFRPVEGLPLIHVEIPQFEGGKHVLKRAFDVVASAAGIIVLTPVFLAVALFIRLDDGGPVFFTQERVGRGQRTFRMVKFRSMVTTAESDLAKLTEQNQGNGLLFKLKDDPRVTTVGRILRKFSIDELPQLWNVLLGDMSLVGPRPPLPREVEAYEDHVHRRLYIKPGLTGMWQVNGRSDLSWDESVRLDLYYVENWSLTGDLMIVWRTVKVLLKPVGAY